MYNIDCYVTDKKGIDALLERGQLNFEDFQIFTQETLNKNLNSHYIYALDTTNNNIVGILKINQVSIPLKQVWCISMVEVSRLYRRQGIAKKLHKRLNFWLKPTDILFWSTLTELGKQSQMPVWGKEIISTCKIFASRQEFDEAYGYDIID